MNTNKIKRPAAALIIYGPQGCGKTHHAAELAAYYCKTTIIDDWQPGTLLPANALALTNMPTAGAISFDAAMRDAGLVKQCGPTRAQFAGPKKIHHEKIKMDSPIIIGTRVAFDSDHGPQTGRVTGFIKCIENGQPHAAIEIDHELDGIVWTMPVAALKPSHVSTK